MDLYAQIRSISFVGLVVLLTGCVTRSPGVPIATGISPADAALEPAPLQRILGEWEGIYFVGAQEMRLSFSLTSAEGNELDAVVRFSPLIERRNALGVLAGAASYEGSYDPVSRTFELVANRWVEEPRMAGVSALPIQGVFDATRPALAGLMNDSRTATGGTRIYFTLTRPEGADALRNALNIGGIPRGNGLFSGAPDMETVIRWASQFTDVFPGSDPYRMRMGALYGPGTQMFADEHFVPFFEKTFDQMGAAERAAIAQRLYDYEPDIYRGFARPFTTNGTQGLTEVMNAVLALRVIESWRELQVAWVGGVPPTLSSFDEIDAVDAAARPFMAIQWPSDESAFAEVLDRARERIAGPAVVASAQDAVRVSSGLSGARQLAAWTDANARLLEHANAVSRTRAVDLVNDRLNELLGPLIATEAATLDDLGIGLIAVQGGNEWYDSYRRRFGFAASAPVYRAPIARLGALRERHLADARPAIEDFLNELGNEAEVDESLRSVLVVPGDPSTSAGRALIRAAESRKAEIADLRRRNLTAFLTGTIAVLSDLARREAEREGSPFAAGLMTFSRDKAIEATLRTRFPAWTEAAVQTGRAMVVGLIEMDLAGSLAAMDQDRRMREIRRLYPDLTWEPEAVELALTLAQSYAGR